MVFVIGATVVIAAVNLLFVLLILLGGRQPAASSDPFEGLSSRDDEGPAAELAGKLASLRERVNEQGERLASLAGAVKALQGGGGPAGGDGASGPAPTGAAGAPPEPSDEQLAAIEAARAEVDARSEALRQEAAGMRDAAVEAGRQAASGPDEGAAAFRGRLEGLRSALEGEAFAEIEAFAGEEELVGALMGKLGECREAVDSFAARLPDAAGLADPPAMRIELPDPRAEFDAACAEGGPPSAEAFAARFAAALDQAAGRLRADHAAALERLSGDGDPAAVEKEATSALPAAALAVITAMEDIEEQCVSHEALDAWCGRHLRALRSAISEAAGLAEVPAAKGEPFDPELHRNVAAPADPEPTEDEQRGWRIREVIRPGYRAGSAAEGECLRPAQVKVAA